MPVLVITRADLYQALFSALPPGTLHYDHECRSFALDDDGVQVELSGGRKEHGAVLIGADGLRSTLRAGVSGAKPPRYAGYSVWQAQVPEWDFPERVLRWVWGPGSRFCFSQLRNGLHWMAVLNSRAGTPPPLEGAKAMLLERFRGWAEPAPGIIEATQPTGIFQLDVFDRDPISNWGTGRVTLLGDAAHPMTFNIGQGSAQAIEDARALAGCLARGPDPETALRRYERTRRWRTANMIRVSRLMGDLGRWEGSTGQAVRDQLLKLTMSGLGQRLQICQFIGGM
jgi:2-polyprenyl-6-methoxyphenol hydroxylase-like FAD-dependent oxidoreductase